MILKSRGEIDAMREAGRVVGTILAALRDATKPGVSTGELDALAAELIAANKVKSAFKGYAPGGRRPYPGVLCTSINEEIVHGIPSKKRILREGDIIGLDFGVVKDGWFADSAITVPVGTTAEDAARLVETTRRSLELGIEQARVGNRIYDIGAAIQAHAEGFGYGVTRDFVGHGVGRRLHEEPQVPNYGPGGQGIRIKTGMVLAIEPMINAGSWEVEELDDDWTAVTADRRLSAHFEHTIAVTEEGPIILTLP
ncbi:Methionine aminopeptidase [Vulgatibacter incomptus]|uniref:Methionine aminopeptidase n=1 Tax=Vulgatibacter incomptus TaxID=1391653 RepID=A0A0K1PDI9_9BACT|nr:Methionine aminopeptidase [Vulgatibacter incomptus]